MDESGINLNFDLDEFDEGRILEIVKSDLVDEVLSQIPNSDIQNFDFYELRSKTVPLSVSLDESPTLKTEAVRSRTQLRQQLMRDQELQKEQERRRRAEEATIATKSIAEPVPIPLNVNNVELPEHVLQVRSALQNPTKYHILAKQKNQVLQFLSSSEPEDFVSKFDAQRASLQLKQQQQQVQLQIHQKQQIQDQQKQQLYQQRQFQQQQRILQRRQLQKRRQLQLQYQEQWHQKKLEEIQNLEHDEKLEQMQLMEHEQLMHQKRQQRQLFYFQQQQQEEELEQQQHLQDQQQLEHQQLLHQHKMEKQQLQQQFQLERQQLYQQQEQIRLRQQLKKQQRQKQLQKQARAEAKAEGEAHARAEAQIRARIRGIAYAQSLEAETEDQGQAKVQEAVQKKAESQAQAIAQEQAQEQAQVQVQLLAQQIPEPIQQKQEQQQELQNQQQQQQLMLPPQKKQQRPEIRQNGQPSAKTKSHDPSPGRVSPAIHSGATSGTSEPDEEFFDEILSFDTCSAMSDLGVDTSIWAQSLFGSLSKDEILNHKSSSSCPSGLQRYAQELPPFRGLHPRDRIRRENHNIVERRRRSNINDRIRELAALLPKVNDPYYEVVKDSKNNKGAILKSSVEYIKLLKFEVNKLRHIEVENKTLQDENRHLVSKLREMQARERENEKEAQMRNQTWRIVKPDALFVSILKNDWSYKNQNNPGAKSEAGSSQPDRMEEDTDKNGMH